MALSGGVDSAVAAALLKTAGWEVTGLHFLLPSPDWVAEKRLARVKGITEFLDIHLETIDLRHLFERLVIDPFVEAYFQGLTPNPCARCNPMIKFHQLYLYAAENRIKHLATGHYVRLGRGETPGSVSLLRGRDLKKEQSYFLHRLSRAILAGTIFPLGTMTKDDTRRRARELKLPCPPDEESQEICFVPRADYRRFLEQRGGVAAGTRGAIINHRGEVVGEHEGIHRHTIGQRHGMGISSSRPYYVKEIRPAENRIIVGRKEDLYSKRVEAIDFNWISGVPESHVNVHAQIRYRHRAAPGRLEVIAPDEVRFIFDEPQWAVTPGQALVCYHGPRVLGGGWIKRPSEHSREMDC